MAVVATDHFAADSSAVPDTQSKQWKSIHDVLAVVVGCDRRIGRNWVGEWGMSPPPPSGFIYFPAAAQWRYNIATLAWMFQSRTMEIDNWFYSTTNCDGRTHLRAERWRQRHGHSHRWRGIIRRILLHFDGNVDARWIFDYSKGKRLSLIYCWVCYWYRLYIIKL